MKKNTVKLPTRYQNIRGSAAGGFGEVIFCQDSNLSRPVAIKFLHEKNELRRLLDELRALLLMRSKHVVQVYDIIPSSDGLTGIVEEYVEGEDLWESEFPRSSSEIYLKTLWQIASGIADIHAAGLVHRDIKPNNMKLDPENIVKIFDFGLARDEGPKAVTNGFVGTIGFAAPELYSAKKVTFTKAIDVYAFGAVSAFLQFGYVPDFLKGVPPSGVPAGVFSNLPLSIPKELSNLLEACLLVNPSSRPNMQEIRDIIAQYLLKGKHQAIAVFGGTVSKLNSSNTKVRLALTTIGTIEIFYNGLKFIVTAVVNEVFINNSPAVVGMEIPGSCVVSLGGSHRRASQRAFITFDVSNPEVIL